jgi:hypothetical protein
VDDHHQLSSAVPVIKGLIDGYKAKLAAGNTSEKIASETASAEIAAQVSETNAIMQYRIAEIGHWYEPDKLMDISWRSISIVGQGSWPRHIDPLAGSLRSPRISWCPFYFAKRGFENVARIIKR